jgi:hypothetical protein
MLSNRDDVLRGVLVCVALSALTGCGSSGSDKASDNAKSGEVATISGTAVPSASKAAQQEGVMLRIDMTQADMEGVYDSYWACLGAHGVKMITKLSRKIPGEDEKDNPAGFRACKAKEPYLDPLLDKTKNPKYADQLRVWMACMNTNGIEVSGNWDDEFLKFGKRKAGIDSKKYLEIYRQCEMASYKW